MFSAAEDKLAYSAPNSAVEQTMQLLTQSGDPQNGITVSQFQKTLQEKNLGTPSIDIQTIVYPSNGISTDMPLPGVGGFSHLEKRFDYEAQGPSVVGSQNAMLLPPGVGVSNTTPVKSDQDQREEFNNSIGPGEIGTDISNQPG